MKTFYVIRSGWNSANQSAIGRPANPKNSFESGRYCLVAIVESDTSENAILDCGVNCYANQSLFAVANPRKVKGLTAAIRSTAIAVS